MFWVVVIVTVLNVGLFLASKVVINKTADKVIEKLQKEYSPSPYGPGLDPDKVNPEALKKQKMYFELRKRDDSQQSQNVVWRQEWEQDRWRQEWEQDRGFSPEQ